MANDDTGADAPEEQGSEGPVGTGTRSGRRWAFAAVAVLALAAVGWFVVRPAVFPPLEQVSGIAPKAPRLNAGTDQRLFRFDPEQSTATYSVKEELAGKKMATAVGSTSAVSGDVVVDDNDASASTTGDSSTQHTNVIIRVLFSLCLLFLINNCSAVRFVPPFFIIFTLLLLRLSARRIIYDHFFSLFLFPPFPL